MPLRTRFILVLAGDYTSRQTLSPKPGKQSVEFLGLGPEKRLIKSLGLEPTKRLINSLGPEEIIVKFELEIENVSPAGISNVSHFIKTLLLSGRLKDLLKFKIRRNGDFCALNIGLSNAPHDVLPSLEHLMLQRVNIPAIERFFLSLKKIKMVETNDSSDILYRIPRYVLKIHLSGINLSALETIKTDSEEPASASGASSTAPINFVRFVSVQKLVLSGCSLSYIPTFGFEQNVTFYYINLKNNRISEFPMSCVPASCMYLNLAQNKISHLSYYPKTLMFSDFQNNQLTELPYDFLLCDKYKNIKLDGNPIFLSIPHRRMISESKISYFLDIEGYIRRARNAALEQTPVRENPVPEGMVRIRGEDFHENAENVHNSSIQKCVLISACNILRINFSSMVKFEGTGHQKTDAILAVWLSEDSRHSILRVSIREVFLAVWLRIQSLTDPETKSEAINRLSQEVQEGKGKCFVGRLSRLINSLVGFFPDVNIHITSADQIYGKIKNHIRRFGKVDRDVLIRELKELDLSDTLIKEWIEPFLD